MLELLRKSREHLFSFRECRIEGVLLFQVLIVAKYAITYLRAAQLDAIIFIAHLYIEAALHLFYQVQDRFRLLWRDFNAPHFTAIFVDRMPAALGERKVFTIQCRSELSANIRICAARNHTDVLLIAQT